MPLRAAEYASRSGVLVRTLPSVQLSRPSSSKCSGSWMLQADNLAIGPLQALRNKAPCHRTPPAASQNVAGFMVASPPACLQASAPLVGCLWWPHIGRSLVYGMQSLYRAPPCTGQCGAACCLSCRSAPVPTYAIPISALIMPTAAASWRVALFATQAAPSACTQPLHLAQRLRIGVQLEVWVQDQPPVSMISPCLTFLLVHSRCTLTRSTAGSTEQPSLHACSCLPLSLACSRLSDCKSASLHP